MVGRGACSTSAASWAATARNVTGRVDALERDGWPNACPTKNRRASWSASPRQGPLSGELLTEQRAALAELLVELPEADQRHMLQALESLRAVLARHPGLSPARHQHGQERAAPPSPSSRRHTSRPPSAQLARNILFDLLCGATSYAPGTRASLLDTL